jgi:hypothetical protein
MRRRKVKGPKRVSYELIDPKHETIGKPIYRLLRELVHAHHAHLADARIAIAWCTSWRPDADGRVVLGKCKKASDLDRELANYDFIILLKKSFWQDLQVTAEQRRALLDHELCHAGVKEDERTGEPVHDERGRKVYRLIKHDIEEFASVVERNGVYKRDLEQFAAALNRAARSATWQPCDECRDLTPGWKTIIDDQGVKRQAKCECVTAHAQRYREAVPA